MLERRAFELGLEAVSKELEGLLPSDASRKKLLAKIVSLALDVFTLRDGITKDPVLQNAAQRYFGLDPLKISGLNLAHALEADEERFARLYLNLAYNLLLVNIMRLRLVPRSNPKFQAHFSAQELAYLPAQMEKLSRLEEALRVEHDELEETVAKLREDYELFLFAESSHEAARSFGATTPNVKAHHTSWVAFSQLLTGLAVKVHDSEKAELIKQARRIEARRETLFESCAELFSRAAKGKDVKKIRRQLAANLTEMKKLETDVESTLGALSVPGLHDYTSFIMKKNSDQSTTYEPNK